MGNFSRFNNFQREAVSGMPAVDLRESVPGGSPAGKKGKREAEDPRKPGTTNVRLKA